MFCSIALAETNNNTKSTQYSDKELNAIVQNDVKQFAKKKKQTIVEIPTTQNDYMEDVDDVYDPLEKFNRVIHIFNGALDMIILEPLAYMYRDTLPTPVQTGVSNFWTNIEAPLYCVNHLLQFNMNDFFQTASAFVLNSTVGILGLFDFSEKLDLKRKNASFDQTLSYWGIAAGPYLVLPIFGASSIRGAFGVVGDMYLDPVSMLAEQRAKKSDRFLNESRLYLTVWGIHLIDDRAGMIDLVNEIKKVDDPYSTIRSGVIQKRKAMEREAKQRRG